MALLSPGIESKETFVSSTIVRSATGRAAIVGKFVWGPANQVTQVTDETALVNQFGSPDNDTAAYFMSGANFLQYGNDLRVVRAIDPDNAKNATPLFNQIETTIENGGQGYTTEDTIKIKYNSQEIETAGQITEVDSSGKITKIFIPTAKIIEHAKKIGGYPNTGDGSWTAEIQTSGGTSASITVGKIVTDSGVMLPNISEADDIITGTTVQEAFQKFDLPVIAAIYPGELGSTLEVEVVSYAAYRAGAEQTIYPYGGKRATQARAILPYGPMTEDQYCLIVRRDGIVQESVVLSTKKGDRDVYGNNIYMDDYFANGSSNFIFATAKGWPQGFSGILQLGGGNSSNTTVTAGHLNKAWDKFADRESLHVNLLIAGAVACESDAISATVQKYAAAIADERQDCLALISPTRSLLVNVPLETALTNIKNWRTGVNPLDLRSAVENNMNISTTYAFIDGNFKYQYDKYNDINRWVPLAGDIAGLCARTDNVAQPWMSPAGFIRGQILNVIKLAIEPKQSQRDELYQLAINPVCGFSGGDGFVLFGDKTATQVPSPFDRVNVRRLFNMLKKNIGDTSKYKLFENNDNFTRASFRMEVSQYLDGIRALGGCYDFRVVCDTSNNTPNVIDRNEFVATIYLKPPRSINYITLNFVATATGANFDELIGPSNVA